MACPHVDLDRGDDQLWHGQLSIAGRAEGHKFFFRFAPAHMHIVGFLLCHSGLPAKVIPARGFLIMAKIQGRIIGQRQYFLNRVIELCGRTAGKIGARGAKIGHE